MKVPILESPQVAPRPLPTPYSQVRTGPEAYGAGAGQALRAVGGEVERIAAEEKQKHDTVRVMQAYSQLGQWQQSQLYDPKNGALSKKGQNAIGLSDTLLKDFDKVSKQISGDLADDDQRRQFESVRQRERESVGHTLAQHERGAMEQVASDSFQGALSTSVSNAANAYADPRVLERERQIGEGAVLVRAQHEGWDKEQTEQAMRGYRTHLHLTVLNRMTDAQDATGAAAYLAKYGGEIDGAARAQSNIDKTIQLAGLRQRTLGEVRRIQSEAGGDAPKQLQLAQGIKDAQLQHEVTQQITAELEQQNKARHDTAVSWYEKAYTSYLKAGSPGSLAKVDPQAKDWLVANEPEYWGRMQTKAREDSDYYRRLREHNDNKATPAQRAAMIKFLLGTAQDPERVVAQSPADFQAEWGHQLAPPDMEQAATRAAAIKSAATKPDSNPALPAIVERRIIERGRAAGAFPPGAPDKWPPEQSELLYSAYQQVLAQEAAHKREHAGKQPTLEQYDKWVDPLMLKGKVPGSGWFGIFPDKTPTVLEYGKNPAFKDKGFVPEWSADELQSVRGALKAKGYRDDDAAVDRVLRLQHGIPAAPTQAVPKTSAPAVPADATPAAGD